MPCVSPKQSKEKILWFFISWKDIFSFPASFFFLPEFTNFELVCKIEFQMQSTYLNFVTDLIIDCFCKDFFFPIKKSLISICVENTVKQILVGKKKTL